jgi:hypothetical protein
MPMPACVLPLCVLPVHCLRISVKLQKVCKPPAVPLRVRRSFSLKAKISEKTPIFFSLRSEKKWFFSLIFALSETLQESENNESETKILSEKLKSLKVIFKYLDSKLVWH